MRVRELINKKEFEVLNAGENLDLEIGKTYCCDLLSIAMSRIPAKAAWVTVMGNINTLAVASLTECSCVILAEGVTLDSVAIKKAQMEGITILSTQLPIFETAQLIAL